MKWTVWNTNWDQNFLAELCMIFFGAKGKEKKILSAENRILRTSGEINNIVQDGHRAVFSF